MSKFLTSQQLYRLFQRELPEFVYPDSGTPSAFFSTSSIYSKAKVIESIYNNLARIYENYFPQTTDENIEDWEVKFFGIVSDSSLSLQERRDRILLKIATIQGITKTFISYIVGTVLPLGTVYEVVEWACGDGAWILDESQLEISTILSGYNNMEVTDENIGCPPTPEMFGLTEQQFEELQEEVYTYEVRIYSYTLSAQMLKDLDAALNFYEPARSQHIISDNLDIADMIGGTT